MPKEIKFAEETRRSLERGVNKLADTSLVLVATCLTSWAPIFSNLSSNSISLAIVTPSFVISGTPYS